MVAMMKFFLAQQAELKTVDHRKNLGIGHFCCSKEKRPPANGPTGVICVHSRLAWNPAQIKMFALSHLNAISCKGTDFGPSGISILRAQLQKSNQIPFWTTRKEEIWLGSARHSCLWP